MTHQETSEVVSPETQPDVARDGLSDFPPAQPFKKHYLGLTDFIDYHERLLKQRTNVQAMVRMPRSEAAFYTAVYETAKAECEYNEALWAIRDATADLNLLAAVELRKKADTRLVECAHELLHRAKRLKTVARMEEVIDLCNLLVGGSDRSEALSGRRHKRRSNAEEQLTETDSD